MRKQAVEAWLKNHLNKSWDQLAPASSDASFRGYLRMVSGTQSLIIMDAPPEQEPIDQFIYVSKHLAAMGIHVPDLHAESTEHGFILMEDLGATAYLDVLNQENRKALYGDAIDALLCMQCKWPVQQALPKYDNALMQREVALFFDWLLGEHLQWDQQDSRLPELHAVCNTLIAELLTQPTAFVHRDYHSRNLMVCEQGNPGVIDFQDAVIGPVTYDIVSLLRDCYIEWSDSEVMDSAMNYFQQANGVVWKAKVDEQTFIRWFDWMGVQRHLKASGIFARLCHRDGKERYLADIPLTLRYIAKVAAKYPELAPLAAFVESAMLPRFT